MVDTKGSTVELDAKRVTSYGTFGSDPVQYIDYNTSVPGSSRGTYGNAPSGSNAPGGRSSVYASNFEIVRSLENLEAELRSASREITEVVTHWTAHFMDQYDVDAYTIDKLHLDAGYSGCGYHFIIKRDGTLQKGRPINIQGAHAGANGPSKYGATTDHNAYSLGISFVAGYTTNASDEAGASNSIDTTGQSITAAQYSTYKGFLQAFYNVFPLGQVLGHYQVSAKGKIDPGFDVETYIYNTFNKTNVYQYRSKRNGDLDIGPPLSRAELINARAGNLPYNYPVMPYSAMTP